jgi:inorganic pyrophosphatase
MHLVKKLLAISVFLCASAQAQNILEFPQPENNPEEFYAVTEIPAGGMIKYETDAKTGFIVADRFQSMPVAYPANYGSLTQSLPVTATRWMLSFIPVRRWPGDVD